MKLKLVVTASLVLAQAELVEEEGLLQTQHVSPKQQEEINGIPIDGIPVKQIIDEDAFHTEVEHIIAKHDRDVLPTKVEHIVDDLVVAGKLSRQGEKGEAGQDGKDGRHGQDGRHGKDGEDGTHGMHGEDGEDGKDGQKGDKGHKGDKGVKGDKGQKGDKGEKGDKRYGCVSKLGECSNWPAQGLMHCKANLLHAKPGLGVLRGHAGTAKTREICADLTFKNRAAGSITSMGPHGDQYCIVIFNDRNPDACKLIPGFYQQWPAGVIKGGPPLKFGTDTSRSKTCTVCDGE